MKITFLHSLSSEARKNENKEWKIEIYSIVHTDKFTKKWTQVIAKIQMPLTNTNTDANIAAA